MSVVFLFGLWIQVLNVCGNSVFLEFRCSFCLCRFFTNVDLDLHLKAFGDGPHFRLWRCRHILLEEDGFNAGVDNHGDWYRGHSVSPNMVRVCRDLLRAERSDVSVGLC